MKPTLFISFTMQNHMPYTDFYPETKFTAEGTQMNLEAHYFQGLS